MTRRPLTTPGPPLEQGQVQRYSRHLLLEEMGDTGQRRLATARVLVVGAGGLAAPVVSYLAAAGVGRLTVVDDDVVELSNLQRQVLFTPGDVGALKAQVARTVVARANPDVEFEAVAQRFEPGNAMDLAADHDLVVDATDNFETRYLLNDTCVLLGLPLVWASVERFAGRAAVWSAGEGPCYRCVFPHQPPAGAIPSCAEAGVLGAVPGVMGAIQAAEVVKLILGVGEPLIGRLLVHDALAQSWDTLPVAADPGCPVCGEAPSITSLPRPVTESPVPEVSPAALRELLMNDGARVIDVRTPAERDIVSLPFAEHLDAADVGVGWVGPPDGRTLVLHCKSGARSAAAVRALLNEGYDGPVASLRGGILAWADEVDPALPRY
ncbi:molybdopterin-synthase adenylyltransferase MoeB [Allobranchiibius sp. GilTou73]|uniref:molybdopterin-synthase adenylyltransferase MoeB n=1 Tax=Allobranchiibius sp. GilTou73 TaxID=2904523 RepID=UPI001F22C5CE|nr:molybdopterin-synthase adenylyltransferase MoeB [Allobranchiibius sp. GilTou73]UIJ34726.1 molybdopterin-synthase adenylyltransferase MoeB [Allobranchiibius sp. GilTou73]